MACADFSDGLIILADQQTAGRGRQGRAWMSAPGNLFCSFLFKEHQATPSLSLVFGVALHAALTELVPNSERVRLKWPNDVLVAGRKISGLLLESGLQQNRPFVPVILGIGLNLSAHPEIEGTLTCDLRECGGPALSPQDALHLLLPHIRFWRELYHREGFAPIREAWLAAGPPLGAALRVRDTDGFKQGLFAGLDGDGQLQITLPDGRLTRIMAGDVLMEPS